MYSFTLELLFSFFSWFQFLGNSPTLFILSFFFLIYFLCIVLYCITIIRIIMLHSLSTIYKSLLCCGQLLVIYSFFSYEAFRRRRLFLACSSVQHSVNLPNIAYRGTYYILLCMSWMRSLRFIYIVHRCANYSKFSFSLEKDTDRLGH